MRNFPALLRVVLPAVIAPMLGGCLGGSIAQQLASTVAVHAADRITAGVVESRTLGTGSGRDQILLADRAPDPYWDDFVTAGFSPVTPQVEPLPEPAPVPAAAANTVTATPLLHVEIWNLLVGEEKRAFLEAARRLDAARAPSPEEWPHWQVAAGGLLREPSQSVTFLIPPALGRLASGARLVVEQAGELHYARYVLD